MASVQFRFYEELNEFLAPDKRKQSFRQDYPRAATVKHVIEALGVPHTEVDLILVNGNSVDFAYRLHDGDRVSVYPRFEAVDITPLLKVRDRPLREVSFIADAHLGALARRLRMLGFDVLYNNGYADAEIASIAVAEHRIVLTRDRALLMMRTITHGCYVRATRPGEQLVEVLQRLDLWRMVQPFTRCLCCNGMLVAVAKESVAAQLSPRTARFYDRYWQCAVCGGIYWEGSHWKRMRGHIETLLAAGGVRDIQT
jgi:uncharacterized protein with PIN domain